MVLKSVVAGFLDPELNYRFQVIIDDIYMGAFTSFQMPDLTVETLPVKEGGQNTFVHHLPVKLESGPAVLKHGLTPDLSLLEWYMQVVNGDIVNAKRQVAILMFNQLGMPSMAFSFRDAYPTKWVAPSLNSEENSVGVQELHFVHHGFTIATMDGSTYTTSSSSK